MVFVDVIDFNLKLSNVQVTIFDLNREGTNIEGCAAYQRRETPKKIKFSNISSRQREDKLQKLNV